MTAAELHLLDAKAAHAARVSYSRAFARLFGAAHVAIASGNDNEAMRLATLASMVRRDYRGEYDRRRR